jgi:asparagine synthase (glutamine-hydrolysing)
MSGIVGIVYFDGATVDPRMLREMTDSMAARGPDRQQIWVDGPVGLGHALLRTTDDHGNDRQLTTLDGEVWITADARIDARTDLIRKMDARVNGSLGRSSDAELILHAYDVWGERCVEHLLGDFAFAIWDGRNRRLFCARDHFGVKPFFYATVPGGVVFSNTLDCVRLHPAVSPALNEVAIADFLRCGWNQDPAATTFAGVQRIPAAHTLTIEQTRQRTERYWTIPSDGRLRYRRAHEYVDSFKELLRLAVGDRLRASAVSIAMSGGLDSTSIAATARQLISDRNGRYRLRAHTVVYDSLVPDNERHYAGIAAEALGVPISFFAADQYRPFDGWEQSNVRTPEPANDPFLLMRWRLLRQVADDSRVLLCGDGGDEVLWCSYVVDVLGKVKLRELGGQIARSLVLYHQRPGAGIRARLKSRARSDREHPLRPEAFRRLTTSPWAWHFESSDPGVTGVPLETRYPFLDVRLVTHLLAMPPFPWFVNKLLLREAMRGTLPEDVIGRAKTPLPVDPLRAHLRARSVGVTNPWRWMPAIPQRVDVTVPRLTGDDGDDPWTHVRPVCLNYWLSRVAAT